MGLYFNLVLLFSYKECCGEPDTRLKTCKLLLKFKAVCFELVYHCFIIYLEVLKHLC